MGHRPLTNKRGNPPRLFVSVSALSADVGFHLGRSASMGSGNILLLLGLGLYLGLLFLPLVALGTSFEGNTPLDYCVNIVTTVIHVFLYFSFGSYAPCPIN